MNRTKIIATVGPSSKNPEVLKDLILEGVNVFRLNMSHINTLEDLEQISSSIRTASKIAEKNISILMDLAGPKIRTNIQSEIKVKENDVLTIGDGKSDIGINMNPGFNTIQLKSKIKIDDGKLVFDVIKKIDNSKLEIRSLNHGVVKNRKGVNFPNIELDLPTLTNKDIEDIKKGLDINVDWFALSFVRSDLDYQVLKDILVKYNCNKPVIAKIEKPEAVENLVPIVKKFDGVLVARGDLGVEIGFEMVPIIQKRIIRKCHKYGKPVILATQMLESMIANNIPTRAEVNDVAVSVENSCDAVMLTAETSIGEYPVEAIKMMKSVILKMENEIGQYRNFKGLHPIVQEKSIQNSICHSACNMAEDLDVDLIIAMTESGSTAISISLFRPNAMLIAMSPNKEVCKKLNLIWGLNAVLVDDFNDSEHMLKNVQKYLIDNKISKKGSQYILIAGVPVGVSGTTNLIRIENI